MSRPTFILLLIAELVVFLAGNSADAFAEVPARLRRIDIKPQATFTRLIFQLDRETSHSLVELPGNRLKLTFMQADAPLLRGLRGYSDPHVRGITVGQRGDKVQVVIGMNTPAGGARLIDNAQVVALDIGPRFRNERNSPPVLSGRESIWNGAGRFVREYDPPLRSELPFVPTDRKALRALLSEEDTRLFMMGEAAVYKGQSSDALEVFNSFLGKNSGISALAAYRCGQAYYNLLEYEKALQSFRTGEANWPQFLDMCADVKFAYADCMMRSGDLASGKKLLTGLIASKAEKKSAPILLVRLADILARQHHEAEARLIYQNVMKFFQDNKAAVYAAIKMADRRFHEVDSYSFPALRDEYLRIYQVSNDVIVREEALFKAALLESLLGSGTDALQLVVRYEKFYPRGGLASLVHSMHFDLMPVVYRELLSVADAEQFVRAMETNADFLAKCMDEPSFLDDLDRSFTALGQKQRENGLFLRLLKRDWSARHAPYLYGKIIDNSLSLAEWQLAESTGRAYIQRFPSLNETQATREMLGDIRFRNGDMAATRADLSFLLMPKIRATVPESYYYLGKAFEAEKDMKQAARAMGLFIAAMQERSLASPLVADAYFVAGSYHLSAGSLMKAKGLLEAGLAQALQEGRDRFLFRIGEVSKRAGRTEEAKKNWERIVKEGSDPVWQRLASQELSDIEWRERTGSGI